MSLIESYLEKLAQESTTKSDIAAGGVGLAAGGLAAKRFANRQKKAIALAQDSFNKDHQSLLDVGRKLHAENTPELAQLLGEHKYKADRIDDFIQKARDGVERARNKYNRNANRKMVGGSLATGLATAGSIYGAKKLYDRYKNNQSQQ